MSNADHTRTSTVRSDGQPSGGQNELSANNLEEVIFSGIQPTGTPHLGNYLGFILPFIKLQNSIQASSSTRIYLCIASLHALTLPRDPRELVAYRRDMLAMLLACGVDPDRTCLFFQEDVPEHTELAWVLGTLCPVDTLQGISTWKSSLATKAGASVESIKETQLNLGLLSYPVLQAADILLFKSTLVPVGDDQVEHLGLTRSLSAAFNAVYGNILTTPKELVVPTNKILNLSNPRSKMSKSHPDENSRIVITDPPSVILHKISQIPIETPTSAITSDPVNRPILYNLLLIFSALHSDSTTPEMVCEMIARKGWDVERLKDEVGRLVVDELTPIREKYKVLRDDHDHLRRISAKGRQTAQAKARETMEEIRRATGMDQI